MNSHLFFDAVKRMDSQVGQLWEAVRENKYLFHTIQIPKKMLNRQVRFLTVMNIGWMNNHSSLYHP